MESFFEALPWVTFWIVVGWIVTTFLKIVGS